MLAFAWPWGDRSDHSYVSAARLGASLCAGIGGQAGTADIGAMHFAYRPLRAGAPLSRTWRPSHLADGRLAVFHGYFDNASAVADELGVEANDLGHLYASAVDQWQGDADLRIVGDYCSVIVDPDRCRIRLARSPLRAPPLYHFHDQHIAIAGSVPRIFFAAGVPQRLNETRVADNALINYTDQEAAWFEGISRVPIGAVVELQRNKPRRIHRFYDPAMIKPVRMASDDDYVARAKELLDEGVRASLRGFRTPGATLSGGLDSPQVAVSALAALPAGSKLPTFTFCPEKGYDGRVQEAMIGDERPLVERFAGLHPGIEPHFTANEGYEHDYRWMDFFHLMGAAPSGLCNLYVFHGLFAGAAKEGCDVLLVSDWGNNAFSDKGYWGYVEYLLTGRWRQLWLALRRFPIQQRSMLWRFVGQCIMPLLPTPIWRMMRRMAFPGGESMLDVVQPLSPAYRAESGADQRLHRAGLIFDRYQPWNARHAHRLLLQNDDGEAAEIYQAFEQMYGVAQRDPLAYRPLVEFCWGLPTRMFMRDGELRWLAKQTAKGIMPEEQRANRLNGRWDADWHLRLGRRRADLLVELDELAGDEKLGRMLDLPRIRAALVDWPDRTDVEIRAYAKREMAVPRALLTARFIRYVEARNER